MNYFTYLLETLGIYLVIQVVILFVLNNLRKPQLINQVGRSVYIALINHAFFALAGIYAATTDPVKAGIRAAGILWILPAGILVGFIYFIIGEVSIRLSRKYTKETLVDLQQIAINQYLPGNVFVPGILNYLVLKPLGEELYFRALILGLLSTQVPFPLCFILMLVLENLRYPQVAWFPRNVTRAVILGALFLLSHSLLLPLTASVSFSVLSAFNQISIARKVAKNCGIHNAASSEDLNAPADSPEQ